MKSEEIKHYDFEVTAREIDPTTRLRIPGGETVRMSASGTFEGARHSLHAQLLGTEFPRSPAGVDQPELPFHGNGHQGCCGKGHCNGVCSKSSGSINASATSGVTASGH